jgi:hypothetical protein
MVNAMYAKDISKKMCAAARIRVSKPDAMPNGSAPFGYKFSEDKKKYLVDPETAPYARMIFQWVLLGVSFKKIAQRLDLLGVMTPGQNRVKNSGKEMPRASWKAGTVYKIVQNPNYTGDIYTGRLRQALYKSESRRWTSPEEWTVRENAHEPIVTREDFQKAQEIIRDNSTIAHSKKPFHCVERERLQDNFQNMIYCSECGRGMHFVRYTHDYTTKTKSVTGYICPSKEGESACGGKMVYEDFIKIVVMDQIQLLIKSMCDYKKMLDKIKVSQGGKNVLLSAQKQMMALKVKIAETEERQVTLYENYAEGLLEQEDYQSIKESYIQSTQQMQEELQQLEKKERRLEKTISQYTEMVKNLETYLGKREFDEKLVHELIERITVSKNNGIEVTFKCNDVYREVIQMIEESDKK